MRHSSMSPLTRIYRLLASRSVALILLSLLAAVAIVGGLVSPAHAGRSDAAPGAGQLELERPVPGPLAAGDCRGAGHQPAALQSGPDAPAIARARADSRTAAFPPDRDFDTGRRIRDYHHPGRAAGPQVPDSAPGATRPDADCQPAQPAQPVRFDAFSRRIHRRVRRVPGAVKEGGRGGIRVVPGTDSGADCALGAIL